MRSKIEKFRSSTIQQCQQNKIVDQIPRAIDDDQFDNWHKDTSLPSTDFESSWVLDAEYTDELLTENNNQENSSIFEK